MQLWTWGPGKKDLQEYKERSTFPLRVFSAIWLFPLSPPQSWGWWSLPHTFPDTHQTWHMGCSREPNVCFQMCLPAPAELLPHHTARDPSLAAKLSRGTKQIGGCPNPDPSLALPLLLFQTNMGEVFPACLDHVSQHWLFPFCPDTGIFFLWKPQHRTGEGESTSTQVPSLHIARYCQNRLLNPKAGEHLWPHDLGAVQVLLEDSCIHSLQKLSFFMRCFSLSISKGNRELFLLRSFRPWSSFWNAHSPLRLTEFQILIFLTCS